MASANSRYCSCSRPLREATNFCRTHFASGTKFRPEKSRYNDPLPTQQVQVDSANRKLRLGGTARIGTCRELTRHGQGTLYVLLIMPAVRVISPLTFPSNSG